MILDTSWQSAIGENGLVAEISKYKDKLELARTVVSMELKASQELSLMVNNFNTDTYKCSMFNQVHL